MNELRFADIARASDSEDEEFEPATGDPLADELGARPPPGGPGATLKASLRL